MKKFYILLVLSLVLFSSCSGDDEPVPAVLISPTTVLVNQVQSFRLYEPLYHFLDSNGNQTGNVSASHDYTNNSVKFYIKPNSTEVYVLERMLIHIKDTGSLDGNSYGNGISLTNGIRVYVQLAGINYSLTNSLNITTNTDWGRNDYDIHNVNFGIGDESLNSRWTFSKAGQPLILNGTNGDEFGLVFHDDFSGLNAHNFQVQGFHQSNLIYE